MSTIDGLTITFAQVTNTANTINTINTQLYQNLTDMKNQMDKLSSTWQSDASNSIRNKFDALQSKFEDYKKVVSNYAKFLNQTVQTYTSMEQQLNSNANAFR